MSKDFLSSADRAYFRTMMRRQINSAVHRRMNTLLLLDAGWSVAQVAAALFLDEGTVRAHQGLYQTEGRRGVERLEYAGGQPLLTPDELAVLKAQVSKELYLSAKAVAAWVRERFAVEYTANAMTKLLKRLGFVYKLPKRVPAKASAEAQSEFLAKTLDPLLKAASDDGSPVYFVDATHAAYDAHAACGWILRGETRELKANHGRVRINVNGALNAATCALIHRQEELITSAAMIALFRDLEAAHPAVPEITVILDNARYNRSKELREWLETSRIKLVYLPPYAPNLNLIERFWGFLKKNVIWNRYYPTFAEFKDAIEKFLQNIGSYRDDLQTLLSHRFHLIGNS
jgi:transposase